MSLLKFLKSREISETPQTPCKIELSEKDIQCIIDSEKRKLHIHIYSISHNEEAEIGIEEIGVSIIEERQVEDRLWAIEVCEPITLPVKIIKPVKKFEEHVEARAPVIKVPPPCKDDEHDWGVEYIFRNFRGDVVAILYRCRKCGRTKRETA